MNKWWVAGGVTLALIAVAVGWVWTNPLSVRPSSLHGSFEGVAGAGGLELYLGRALRWRQKLGITKVNLVVTDKMRTDCPWRDTSTRKELKWGMATNRLQADELVVYVWGRDDVVTSALGRRELGEYIAGCLKRMGREGKVAQLAGPLGLDWWERALLAPLTLKERE